MTDQVKILIQFTASVNNISFTDTIVLTQEEYASMTPEQIDAIKQERISNWSSVMDSMAATGTDQAVLSE